jgi:rubrerythrin
VVLKRRQFLVIIHTASEGITLARKLENDSAVFYETLAQQGTKGTESFLAFAKENKKNVVQFERAYYGVITDAIEGCFAFNIDTDDYTLDIALARGTSYADIINQALKMEEKIIKFYSIAAEQSKSLMADLPRTFSLIVKKRDTRILKLRSL